MGGGEDLAVSIHYPTIRSGEAQTSVFDVSSEGARPAASGEETARAVTTWRGQLPPVQLCDRKSKGGGAFGLTSQLLSPGGCVSVSISATDGCFADVADLSEPSGLSIRGKRAAAIFL